MSRDFNTCSTLLTKENLNQVLEAPNTKELLQKSDPHDIFKFILDSQTKAQKYLRDNKQGLPLVLSHEWITQTYHFVHDEITEVYELFPSTTWKRHKQNFPIDSQKPLKTYLKPTNNKDIPAELFFEFIDLVHFIPNYAVPINEPDETEANGVDRLLAWLKITINPIELEIYKDIPVIEFMENVRILGILNGKVAYLGLELAEIRDSFDIEFPIAINPVFYKGRVYLKGVSKAWNLIIKLTKILFDNVYEPEIVENSAIKLLLPYYDKTTKSLYKIVLIGYLLKNLENYKRWNSGY